MRPLEYVRGNCIDKFIKRYYTRLLKKLGKRIAIAILSPRENNNLESKQILSLNKGLFNSLQRRFSLMFVVFFSIATILQPDSISTFRSYSALQTDQLRSYVYLIRLQHLFIQRRFVVQVILYNQNVSSICFTYITIYLLLRGTYKRREGKF